MDLKDEIIQRVVKERLGEPNGTYKKHIHQDLVKEMMEKYHQSKVNNGVLDDVNYCKKTLSGVMSWLESDYCKIIDTNGNELRAAQITGTGFKDYLEKYCS